MRVNKGKMSTFTLEFFDDNVAVEDVKLENVIGSDDPNYFEKMLKKARRNRFEKLGDMYGWRYEK